MTEHADCARCQKPIRWIDCPTGGWWAHFEHPADDHDAHDGYRSGHDANGDGEM